MKKSIFFSSIIILMLSFMLKVNTIRAESYNKEQILNKVDNLLKDTFKRYKLNTIDMKEINEVEKKINKLVVGKINLNDVSKKNIDEEKSFFLNDYDTVEPNVNMNAKERALCAKNVAACAVAWSNADYATKQASTRYSKYTLRYGNGDAYRHALWFALVTKYTSRNFAYQLGYAHENLKTGAKAPDIEVAMDISNNYSGRKNGTAWKKLGDGTIADYTKALVHGAGLKRIAVYANKKTCSTKRNLKKGSIFKYANVCIKITGSTKTSAGGEK